MIIFAEASASPTFTPGELAAWLGIAVFILSAIVLARKVFGHEPALHKEYATRSELQKMERELKDDLTKQAGARKGMHQQIEQLGRDQAKLEAQNEFQIKQLTNLDGKIDRLLERMPRSG
jgi:Skp family chaperone for outer membrane proteins